LEAQVAADLAQIHALIAADAQLDPARVTFAGVGLAAELARAALSPPRPFRYAALDATTDPPATWFREVLDRAC
ncbi:MAG: hypothetical protein ACREBE_26090, partial [bacterium]